MNDIYIFQASGFSTRGQWLTTVSVLAHLHLSLVALTYRDEEHVQVRISRGYWKFGRLRDREY